MNPTALHELINDSWQELADLVDGLGRQRLVSPGPDRWTAKDHIVHVAAWEQSLLALVEGRDRLAAMGLGHVAEETTDAFNDAVWKLHLADSPEDALKFFRESHADLMAALDKLSTEDLELPYSHYQPGVDDPPDERPVLTWVVGNTYEHYAEHSTWIKALPPG